MRKRVGTKLYDTETAILVDTTPEGIQVYRKKNSPQFFLYNPSGKTAKEMFFELPPDSYNKYLVSPVGDQKVKASGATVLFSQYDRDRIKLHADKLGMSMSKFLLMLVDEYERQNGE